MADDTSVGSGATPEPTPPATGTPASPGVTPEPKPQLTLEEVLKRNAELEHSHKNAREQADRQAKLLDKYQKQEKEQEAAKKAADDAQLTEIERIKKQHADAEARNKQLQSQLVMAEVKLAAKDKGFYNPSIVAKNIQDELEYDENGNLTNLEKVLDALAKSDPYLLKPAEPAPAAQPTQTTPPALPAMSPERGRSGFASPSQATPGKPLTLAEVPWKR